MTVQEVAEYLKRHPVTIYRWCNSGIIPFHRTGRNIHFFKDEIDLWIAMPARAIARRAPKGSP